MNDMIFDPDQSASTLGPASSSRLHNHTNMSVDNDDVSSVDPNEPSTPKLTTKNFKLNLNKPNTVVNTDQALLSAIYNSAAIGLLVICVGLCGLLFVVLQAFVRAILWALLTSACLFSLKRFLTDTARCRLEEIEKNDSILALEVVILPIRLVNSSVDWTWSLMKRRYRYFLALGFGVFVFNLGSVFSYGPIADTLLKASIHFFSTVNQISDILTYYADDMWVLTSTLVLVYLLAIVFYWNETNTTLFQVASLPVWLCIFFLTSSLMGAYRPLFLFTFGLLVLIGIYAFVFEHISNYRRKLMMRSRLEDEAVENIGSIFEDQSEETKTPEASQHSNSSFLKTTILNIYHTSIYYLNSPDETPGRASPIERRKKENSDKYFIMLFWLFAWVKLRYDFFILIPALVVIWKVARNALVLIVHLIGTSSNYAFLKDWFVKRRKILAPRPFIIVGKLFRKGDHKCIQVISNSMDNIVTAFIMVSLVLAVICSVIILCIQVQSESTQLISFGSNILNEQLYSKPEWHEWLPEKERLNRFYHTMIKKFHSHGRDWLSHNLKSIDSSNSSDYVLLEAQILDQWDNLYVYLSQQTSHSNANYSHFAPLSVPPKISLPQNDSHRTVATQTPRSIWFWSNYKPIAALVKDNLGVVMSIVDSLYQIFKGNLNLVATIVWTVVTTVFSSGFALANFFFSFLVYMTFVFYLLSSPRYKPLRWIAEFKLFEQNQFASGLSEAIEDSIRSVFVASLKMATFFGIYTYTVNNLFSVSIIYLPSILAGLLAFLPLLGTYWVCIPGVLELWFVQNRPISAVLFFVMHLVPTLLAVDNAIYSEIKAGHPYLTGLAFAGGVYCLGLEGALIGPIVLCLLIVIVRVITNANLSEHFKGYQLIRTPSVERR